MDILKNEGTQQLGSAILTFLGQAGHTCFGLGQKFASASKESFPIKTLLKSGYFKKVFSMNRSS